jgi:hypothetical protein
MTQHASPHESVERELQAAGSVRIDCAAATDFVDVDGFTWLSDRFVTGGTVTTNVVTLPTNPLARVYGTERWGSPISYAIPIPNGSYRVGLHFIETYWTGLNQRLINVFIQDQLVISALDIFQVAGGQRIPIVQYATASVGGGVLNIRLVATRDNARIDALEIVPLSSPAVRIDTGAAANFVAPGGAIWLSDRYFTGGIVSINSVTLPNNPLSPVYGTERYGTPVSYAIPIPNGSYRVGLHFIETYWTAPGRRLFNVFVQDVMVLSAFDIFQVAGGNRVPTVQYTTASVTTNMLRIRLVATADNARIDAIEILSPSAGSNTAPLVNAGSGVRLVANPNVAITLQGSATDDGLPNPPASLTIAWTVVSGPGTVAFTSASDPRTSATFSALGNYVLTLTASDGQLSSTARVAITVVPTPLVSFPSVRRGCGDSRRAPCPLHAPQGYPSGAEDRLYAVNLLERMTRPVFECLANRTLRQSLPVDATPQNRIQYMYDEAFTRALAGLASWLELGPDTTTEGQRRASMQTLVIRAVTNAFDPTSPDYSTFTRGTQSYVEASFLALAMVRAPTQVWARLSAATQAQIVDMWRRVSGSGNGYPDNNFVSVPCIDGGS